MRCDITQKNHDRFIKEVSVECVLPTVNFWHWLTTQQFGTWFWIQKHKSAHQLKKLNL